MKYISPLERVIIDRAAYDYLCVLPADQWIQLHTDQAAKGVRHWERISQDLNVSPPFTLFYYGHEDGYIIVFGLGRADYRVSWDRLPFFGRSADAPEILEALNKLLREG